MSYRVIVKVEEIAGHVEDVRVIAEIASWEIGSGLRFGACHDAVNHGQKVRAAGEKILKSIGTVTVATTKSIVPQGVVKSNRCGVTGHGRGVCGCVSCLEKRS